MWQFRSEQLEQLDKNKRTTQVNNISLKVVFSLSMVLVSHGLTLSIVFSGCDNRAMTLDLLINITAMTTSQVPRRESTDAVKWFDIDTKQ